MIPGFEDFTVDVVDSEKEVIVTLAISLRKRIGKDNAITNAQMRQAIFDWQNIKIGGPKMRKYIQYIRVHNMVPWLCANSSGYYVASTYEEWIKYREGYRSRCRSMQFTMACMDIDQRQKKTA